MAGRDKIMIRELRVKAIIGVDDWERQNRQEIILNLTLSTDTARAGARTCWRTRSTIGP